MNDASPTRQPTSESSPTHFFKSRSTNFTAAHPTEAAFFKDKLGYGRSTSLRLAKEGRLLHRLSSVEDKVVGLFTSDRHLRPLLRFKDDEQDAAIRLARKWMGWAGLSELSPKLMEAAVIVLYPTAPPAEQKESNEAQMATRFRKVVEDGKALLPEKTAAPILRVFDNMAKKVTALPPTMGSSTPPIRRSPSKR